MIRASLALLLVAGPVLAPACRGAPDPEAPRAAVETLARCEAAGDRACAGAILDLDARAAALFPRAWAEAGPEAREAARALLLDQFMSSAAASRRPFGDGAGELSVIAMERDRATVLETGGGTLSFEYHLLRDGDAWRVTERVRIERGKRLDPAVLVSRFLRTWEAEHGRPPALEDVNRDLPGFLGTNRARMVTVPPRRGGRPR